MECNKFFFKKTGNILGGFFIEGILTWPVFFHANKLYSLWGYFLPTFFVQPHLTKISGHRLLFQNNSCRSIDRKINSPQGNK